MGNEESKVLGIPYVLIGFVVINALIVLVPVIWMQAVVISEVKKDATPQVVKEVVVATPTVAPTVSPVPVRSTIVRPTITSAVRSSTSSGVIR